MHMQFISNQQWRKNGITAGLNQMLLLEWVTGAHTAIGASSAAVWSTTRAMAGC